MPIKISHGRCARQHLRVWKMSLWTLEGRLGGYPSSETSQGGASAERSGPRFLIQNKKWHEEHKKGTEKRPETSAGKKKLSPPCCSKVSLRHFCKKSFTSHNFQQNESFFCANVPQGWPGSETSGRSGARNIGRTQRLGAEMHDPKCRTSTTKGGSKTTSVRKSTTAKLRIWALRICFC